MGYVDMNHEFGHGFGKEGVEGGVVWMRKNR